MSRDDINSPQLHSTCVLVILREAYNTKHQAELRTPKGVSIACVKALTCRLRGQTNIMSIATPEGTMAHACSCPAYRINTKYWAAATLYRDLKPQQITLPDPTNMFKRPNVLCCYGTAIRKAEEGQRIPRKPQLAKNLEAPTIMRMSARERECGLSSCAKC